MDLPFDFFLVMWTFGFYSGGHCASMCGGIIIALSLNKQPWWRVLLYHVGRISSYTLMGLVLGWALHGQEGWWGQARQSWKTVLLVLACTAMLLMAAHLWGWQRAGRWMERMGLPIWQRIRPWALRLKPQTYLSHTFLCGMAWGWIPCGIVYGALLSASAAQTHPLYSALAMLCFGLGTLPNLMALSYVSQRVLHRYFKNTWVRRCIALVLVCYTIYFAWTMGLIIRI